MLKTFVVLTTVLMLGACVSEPVDPSFVGTGAIDKSEAAKTRVSLGLTYLKNGNFSQAKTNLDKAIEFAPRSGEVHYAMAYYYQQVGENDIAEEYYENALGFSRNAPDVVNSYAVFLCQQGKYEKAKEYYLKAINSRNYSATAETYENLAICTLSHGDKTQALTYFESALNHQPTRPRSLFLIAQTHADLENWEAAKKFLWRYERNAQVSAESLYLQYQIAQGLGDTKAAVGYGDLLTQMFPEHENTRRFTAQMGKFKPAAKVVRKLANVQPASVVSSAESSIENEVVTKQDGQGGKADASTNEVPLVSKAPAQINENTEKLVENDGFHVVQPKENLYRISLKYNVKMNKLLEWNNLNDASSIKIGSKLRVREPNNNE
ncbi:type IV pilus biogenesis/stability protein PilW [Agaribacter flavus]|uniref:Type IV pilus biogenesis/stability protein PilW n=1 Tax=Agaribacter flavus TaxID=1902781 RepID=A0ABV7FLE0_9ALTE